MKRVIAKNEHHIARKLFIKQVIASALILSTVISPIASADNNIGAVFLEELGKELSKSLEAQNNTKKLPNDLQSSDDHPTINEGGKATNTTGSLYKGPARWSVGTGIIYEASADASMTVALKLQKNPKASSKISAKEYFNTVRLEKSSKKEYWFLDNQGVDYKPHLIQCNYKEVLEPSLIKPNQLREINLGFWERGTRVALHPRMDVNFQTYSHKIIDAEVDFCPDSLAHAFEIGLGREVWKDIEPKFQNDFSGRLKVSKDYLAETARNESNKKGNHW